MGCERKRGVMDESEVFDLSYSVIFSEMEETERGGL